MFQFQSLLRVDSSYEEGVSKYEIADTVLAFIVLVGYVLSFILGLVIYVTTLNKFPFIVNIVVTKTTLFLVSIVVRLRPNRTCLIGRSWIESLICGLLLGLVIFLIAGCSASWRLTININNLGFILLAVYYFVFVGATEEIVCRWFIQPRLYGMFRSGFVAVLLGAVLFAFLHVLVDWMADCLVEEYIYPYADQFAVIEPV